MGTRTSRAIPLNTSRWQKLRASVLADEPLCRHCAAIGKTKAATDVDHINNDPDNNERSNLQALCHECHSRKTAADMGRHTATAFGVDGLPVMGWTAAQLQKSPATRTPRPGLVPPRQC